MHWVGCRFGAALSECELVTSYDVLVPRTVVTLWKALLATPGGVRTEHLFRQPADPKLCLAAERELTSSKGLLTSDHPPQVPIYAYGHRGCPWHACLCM